MLNVVSTPVESYTDTQWTLGLGYRPQKYVATIKSVMYPKAASPRILVYRKLSKCLNNVKGTITTPDSKVHNVRLPPNNDGNKSPTNIKYDRPTPKHWMNIAKSNNSDKFGYVIEQSVKKDECRGLSNVFEHFARINRPYPAVKAANNTRNTAKSTPSARNAYGIANRPAPKMVFTRFTVDERTVPLTDISVNSASVMYKALYDDCRCLFSP